MAGFCRRRHLKRMQINFRCAAVRREDEQQFGSLWRRRIHFVMSETQPPMGPTMPELTLSEAAKWAGVTRPTIHKALTSGRLSGRKGDNGQWKIAVSELDRIYARSKTANMSGNTSIAELMAAKDREIALHRRLAEQAEATAADLRKERDRLLGIVEAAGRLLTQQASKAPENSASHALVMPPPPGTTREKRLGGAVSCPSEAVSTSRAVNASNLEAGGSADLGSTQPIRLAALAPQQLSQRQIDRLL
jgi:hypothetical protein